MTDDDVSLVVAMTRNALRVPSARALDVRHRATRQAIRAPRTSAATQTVAAGSRMGARRVRIARCQKRIAIETHCGVFQGVRWITIARMRLSSAYLVLVGSGVAVEITNVRLGRFVTLLPRSVWRRRGATVKQVVTR